MGRAKGCEQLYEAYRGSGLTLEEFEGPRYQRIGHINMLIANGALDSSLRQTQAALLEDPAPASVA